MTVWAHPELKWDGFEPYSYSLDFGKIEKLSLTDSKTGKQITIGQILAAFQDETVKVDDRTLELSLKSTTKELVLKGPTFYLELLKIFYRLKDQNLSPFDVSWFYYDSDSAMTEPQTRYSFFWVAQNRIVEEEVCLFDSLQSGFDPRVLATSAHDKPFFHFDEKAWERASDKYWYRKFYEETRMGQLMLLRPDDPELFYYRKSWLPRKFAGLSIDERLFHIHGVLRSIRFGVWMLVILILIYLLTRTH